MIIDRMNSYLLSSGKLITLNGWLAGWVVGDRWHSQTTSAPVTGEESLRGCSSGFPATVRVEMIVQ